MATNNRETNWFSSTALIAKLKTSQQVGGVLRQCGKMSNWIHPDSAGENQKLTDFLDEPRRWLPFEQSDLMEQGMAAGIASGFMEVPDEEVRLCLERSPDRKEYLLTTEDGSRRLLARITDNGFKIFAARDGEPPIAIGPMFSVAADPSGENWTLCATTCDQCEMRGRRNCGSRELAYISHHKEQIVECDGEFHCLDVEIPLLSEDGSMEVWCPMCNPERSCHTTQLTTRKPKWNPRRRDVCLDFFGRCSLASSKNFQLQVHDKPEKVRLLFGKVGPHNFVLDFRRPLSMVQAFAAAVTAFAWQ